MLEKILKLFSFLLVLLIFYTCESKYTELSYPAYIENKKSSKPNASIFEFDKQITISWKIHKDADEYELYKDTNYNGSFTEKIYTGKNLSFVDTLINDNRFYYYKIKAVGELVNYQLSDTATGLYSSCANSILNTTRQNAMLLNLDQDYTLPVFTFFNNSDVRRTTCCFFYFAGDNNDYVLNAEFPVNPEVENSILYIQYIIDNTESIRYPVTMGGRTRIGIPKTESTVYFRVVSDNVEPQLTEDVGSFNLCLSRELLSKRDVHAETYNNSIRVSWTTNIDELKYEVYKSINHGQYNYIGECSLGEYTDNNVSAGNDYQYYVIIYHSDGLVEVSDYSNIAYLPTGDYMIGGLLNASVLTYNNKIALSWNAVNGVTGYAVYRYFSKTDTDPVRLTTSANNFDDISCLTGVPYFYKVACIVNEREYLKNDYFAFGLYYTNVDYYEPDNNDISNMIDDTTTIFDEENPPVIYSVTDGLGNTLEDIDFYKYRGPVQMVFVYITLPSGTPFNDGELTFRWYFNGSYYGSAEPINTGTVNMFSFDDFGVTSGTVDLYCEVIINTASGINKVGSYNMEITTGF